MITNYGGKNSPFTDMYCFNGSYHVYLLLKSDVKTYRTVANHFPCILLDQPGNFYWCTTYVQPHNLCR